MVGTAGRGNVFSGAVFLFLDSGNTAGRNSVVARLHTSLDGAPFHDCGR